MPYGPVPDQYEQILSEECKNNIIDYKCEFKNNYESHNITKKVAFKKELFTDKELEIMNQVKDFFEKYGSKDIVEFSHKEKAFIENDYYKPISYDYAFDINSLD